MFYISCEDQLKIRRRMKRLPAIFRGEPVTILAFETVSTMLLTYGVCISTFKHPIINKKPDPACDIFIACFYYFSLSVAAPFTGGHMNPSTTIAFHLLKRNKNMVYYFIGQFLGATIAILLGTYFDSYKANWFFDVIPASYVE